MAGTVTGGRKAYLRITERDKDFYRHIGQIGGKVSTGGGFTGNPELAAIAGRIGGKIGKRGKNKTPKSEANALKQAFKEQRRALLARQAYLQEQSDDSVSKLSAKYGQARPW